MKRKIRSSETMLFAGLFFLLIIALIYCGVKLTGKDNDIYVEPGRAVEVYVNGEPLYVDEVDATLELNEGLSRQVVVENTIDEMLMIQYAKASGVNVSDKEVNDVITEYETHFPEIYSLALDGYGEEGLKEGLRNQQYLSHAMDMILSDPNYAVTVNDSIIDEYLEENGISPDSLSEAEYNEATNLYIESQELAVKDSWVEAARASSEIIYEANNMDR